MRVDHEGARARRARQHRLSRRQLLRIGGVGLAGLDAARSASGRGREDVSAPDVGGWADPLVHPDLLLWRSQPYRYVRHEAERPGGDPRPVRLDRDQRAGVAGLRAPARTRPG